MKKLKYPRYVKLTHPKGYTITLKFFWGGIYPKYWRLAGAWSIGCEFVDKKLVAKIEFNQAGYDILKKLNGLELIPCTRNEFLEDNQSEFNYRFYGETDIKKIG